MWTFIHTIFGAGSVQILIPGTGVFLVPCRYRDQLPVPYILESDVILLRVQGNLNGLNAAIDPQELSG